MMNYDLPQGPWAKTDFPQDPWSKKNFIRVYSLFWFLVFRDLIKQKFGKRKEL